MLSKDGVSHLSATDAGQPLASPSTPVVILGTVCCIWYIIIVAASLLGYTQLWRHYSSPKPRAPLETSDACPAVTVIRPVKGIEPHLYECLAATFRQTYPRNKLKIFFCVADRRDPALPILERVLHDFPAFDAEILVEEEDPELQDKSILGPNPKIRNISRAYRRAKGDIVWIIDCNVWVAKGTCGRMVDTLRGQKGKPNKFVHLLPLVVDTAGTPIPEYAQRLLGDTSLARNLRATTTSTAGQDVESFDLSSSSLWAFGGGRLEELFMSSSHAKLYTAINTILLAPCIVGKSTMFRRSHLNSLTDGRGTDYFSENICEDHLIGDVLWKQSVPEEKRGEAWGKHALVFGDLAMQPMAGMSVADYVARRVRWLRVRKFTVALATLVEPGTESFLCSLYGAFALTTLPVFRGLGVPPTWAVFTIFWLLSVGLWCFVDWTLYIQLHSAASIELDQDTPDFARPPKGKTRRTFTAWLAAWLGREILAFPIWFWAVFGGMSVVWRGKRFWVGLDMKVHEYHQKSPQLNGGIDRSEIPSKARRE